MKRQPRLNSSRCAAGCPNPPLPAMETSLRFNSTQRRHVYPRGRAVGPQGTASHALRLTRRRLKLHVKERFVHGDGTSMTVRLPSGRPCQASEPLFRRTHPRDCPCRAAPGTAPGRLGHHHRGAGPHSCRSQVHLYEGARHCCGDLRHSSSLTVCLCAWPPHTRTLC